MVRKTRSDKKGTTCERCGHRCSTPQRLREYLKRKNLCKPLQDQKDVASTKVPIQAPIQEFKQHPIRESVQISEPELQTTAQNPASKPELIHGIDYITKEEAKKWVNPNARKPGEHFRT
jgi:hypothetical protein